MKKTFFYLAVSLLIAVITFMGCHSDEGISGDVQTNAARETLTVGMVKEWKAYKTEWEKRIAQDENRIAAQKLRIKRKGKTLAALYEIDINSMEKKINDLKDRIEWYENYQSYWGLFKREINQDLNEVEQEVNSYVIK